MAVSPILVVFTDGNNAILRIVQAFHLFEEQVLSQEDYP